MMKTILIIEDNADILENLAEYFQSFQYRVLPASNGKSGVELAQKNLPDLIICDICMSDMDGYEVLQHIQMKETTNKIPFIFTTAKSEQIEQQRAFALGADDYLIKPYDMELLLQKIQLWICKTSKRCCE